MNLLMMFSPLIGGNIGDGVAAAFGVMGAVAIVPNIMWLLINPSLDWSLRRAKFVFISLCLLALILECCYRFDISQNLEVVVTLFYYLYGAPMLCLIISAGVVLDYRLREEELGQDNERHAKLVRIFNWIKNLLVITCVIVLSCFAVVALS